jgi:phosphatidylserine/phosphatidylglycerophosphate/cardiolipin synthase-like enzyme
MRKASPFGFALVLLCVTLAGATFHDIIDLHENTSYGTCTMLDSTVTITGIITVGFGTFCGTYSTYTDMYIQDATAGVMLYHPSIPDSFAAGDSVTITGLVEQYRGMTEVVPDEAQTVIHGSGCDIPETTVVTCYEVDNSFHAGYDEPNEGRLVRINDATWSGTWPSSITVSDASGSCDMYLDADTGLGSMTPPGGRFDVVGVIKQYAGFSGPWTSDYQIMPRYESDFIPAPGPAIIEGPEATNLTSSSATITWTTDTASDSRVDYGTTALYELGYVYDGGHVTEHEIDLTGLDASTIHHYKVTSTDGSGTNSSGDRLFITLSAGSTGEIRVWFSRSVDHSYATGDSAEGNADLAQELIDMISAASHSVDVCIYSFTLSDVADELIAAHNAGVDVRVIYDDHLSDLTQINRLISAGIPVIDDTFGSNSGDGSMHNKFVIFDARDATSDTDDWVWTGSFNFTYTGSNNQQNVIAFQDQALATIFTAEFEEMWGSSTNTPNASASRFGDNKTDNVPHHLTVGGVPVEVYFCPKDGATYHICEALATADRSTYFSIFAFTRWDIANTMRDNWENVPYFQLKGVFDSSASGNAYSQWHNMSGGSGSEPWSPAADVHLDNESYSCHHKYAIVDCVDPLSNPGVLTGSQNWSSSAEYDNDENVVFVWDDTIANLYLQEFAERYHNSGGTEPLTRNFDPALAIRAIAGDIQLQWQAISFADSYLVYSDTDAFFAPSPSNQIASLSSLFTSYIDTGAAGNPATNHFYVLRAVDNTATVISESDRVGEFDVSTATPAAVTRPAQERVAVRY